MSRKNATRLVLIGVACAATTGCGTMPPMPSSFLKRDDVINIAPGDAVGSSFHGRRYRFVSFRITTCECTAETPGADMPCSVFDIAPPSDGSVIQLGQADGQLWIEAVEGDDNNIGNNTIVAGAINADGRFIFGGIGRVVDNQTGQIAGESILIWRGQLTNATMFVDYTERLRASRDNDTFDCQMTGTLNYVRTN